MRNPIDLLVGFVSPAAGLRRHYQRAALKRAHESASPRDTWRPARAGASANADHHADAQALRDKARALVQNVPYIRSSLDGKVAYLVGTGIISRSIGKRHAKAFNAAWEAWSAVCDADGRHDWPGLQALIQRTAEVDGEVLIRLRPRRIEDRLPIPLQLQVLEIDWLDSSRNGVIDGEEVVNGIAYSALGKPAGYYLWDRHPGDLNSPRSRRTGSTRVDARNILHYYDPQRPGQGRGFSNLASIIARTRDVQTYEDAELARKNQESRLGVLASGDLSQMENPPTSAADSPIGDLGQLPSGSIVGLPAGVNLQLVEPKAVPGHVDYLKYNLHIIAAGWGIPYELMTGDVGEASYSSARVNLLNFRRRVQAQQWLCIVPRLIAPICRAAEDAAVLGGVIPRAEYAYDHSVPKWEYVNPEQDVKADLQEIWGGMSSISEKLRQRGYTDAGQVFDELGRDMQRLNDTGALPLLLAMAGKAQAAEPTQGTTL